MENYNHPLRMLIFKKGYKSTVEFCEKANINRATLAYLYNGRTKQLAESTCYKIAMELNEPYEKILELARTNP